MPRMTRDEIQAVLQDLADAEWISAASPEVLKSHLFWISDAETALPPRRWTPKGPVVLVEASPDSCTDAELALLTRLTRHMSAVADVLGGRDGFTMAVLNKQGRGWTARRLTWLRPEFCEDLEEAAALLFAQFREISVDKELASYDESANISSAPAIR